MNGPAELRDTDVKRTCMRDHIRDALVNRILDGHYPAGTQLKDGQAVTSGGRVLCATALGDSVGAARRAAYALVEAVHFEQMQYRTDIGHLAVAREVAARG